MLPLSLINSRIYQFKYKNLIVMCHHLNHEQLKGVFFFFLSIAVFPGLMAVAVSHLQIKYLLSE